MSAAQTSTPIALWYMEPGRAELRPAVAAAPGPDEVRVQALFGGISRGTESLIFHGRVPESEWQRMRAPFQEGAFPFPVKYGYATVGRVVDGPDDRLGQTVFCLYPHQTLFTLPAGAAVPLPAALPAGRAVLAANLETAVNATWDAPPSPGDRIAVIGGGVVGALVAWLCGRVPGTAVTLVDVRPERAALAAALGVGFALPPEAPEDCDLVFHSSATAAGLATALGCAGIEATVVELSWYGAGSTPVPLGGAFHSRRLTLKCSQVGALPADRRGRWDFRRRLGLALDLLAADARLEVLIDGEIPFAALPDRLPELLDTPGALCRRIAYPAEPA